MNDNFGSAVNALVGSVGHGWILPNHSLDFLSTMLEKLFTS
jgi:hypothetical protein